MERLGVGRDTYRAVGLLPLIYVAWADGELQASERRVIARVAREKGWLAGAEEEVLRRWLDAPPSAMDVADGLQLLDLLIQRKRGVGAVLHPSDRRDLVDACREVAEAAGGFFGLSEAVTEEEAAALEEVALALRSDESPRRNEVLPLPPGPRGAPLLGLALALLRDPLGCLAKAQREHGDLFRLRVGVQDVYFMARPEHAQRVLIDAVDNYVRGEPFEPVRELGGENLVTAEGAVWRRKRRIAQPAFQHEHLAKLHARVVALTADMLSDWQERGGELIDLDAEMSALTLRVIGTLLCGIDLSDTASEMGGAMREVMTYVAEALSPLRPPLAVPTPSNLRVRAAQRKLHGLVDELIAERRASDAHHHDLLSFLMAARDADTGDALSDEELRAETLNFIVAGHETTAVALTWTLYLLSLHPMAARRVQLELRSLGGEPPDGAKLRELNYLERVVYESMRLFPPAHTVPRRAVSEDEIDGFRIPAGATVAVCIWLIHHHKDLWDNPEGFDPDRFVGKAEAERHRAAFIPFAAGPHKCIGMPLAMMEAKIILAMVLQRFRLDLPPGAQAEPHPRATLRPKASVMMRLVPR